MDPDDFSKITKHLTGVGSTGTLVTQMQAMTRPTRNLVGLAGMAASFQMSNGLFGIGGALSPAMQLSGMLSSLTEPVSRMQRTLAPMLQMALSLQEDGERFKERLRVFSEIMVALGWPPPMHMRSSRITEVIALGQDDPEAARAAIEAIIKAEYDSDTIDRMVQGWADRPCMALHLDALHEARENLTDHRYRSVVAVVLPIAEALLVHAWGTNEHVSHRRLKRFANEVLEFRDADPSDRALAAYVTGVHFAQFYRGDPIPDTPGRHAVLHGAHVTYGTVENALRVLILVDMLSEALVFTAAKRGKVVHLPTCGRAPAFWRDRRMFPSLAAAEAAGLRRARCCASRVTQPPP